MLHVDYPMLAQEFCFEQNPHVDFYKLRSKSNKLVWWICPKGHKWEAKVHHRTISRSGCPYCSNKKVLAGFNDLATVHPNIAAEWDYEATINKNLLPSEVGAGSSAKVGFVCGKGHHYVTSVRSRSGGSGCNICHGLVVLEGFNDLLTISPNIAAEWDYEAIVNKNLRPEMVSNKTSRKVGWLCDKGHSYMQKVSDRTRTDSKNTGCPYCSNRKVLVGFNDILTIYPSIAAEWDYESETNKGLLPEMFTGGKKKIAWVCHKGHKWVASIHNRCSQKQDCPRCSLKQTSKVEKMFREQFELKTGLLFPSCSFELFEETDGRKNLKVDMFCVYGSKKVVVEYDGVYWHKDKKVTDILKTIKLLNAGFKVVRIREKYLDNQLPLLPVKHKNLLQLSFDSYLSDSFAQDLVVSEAIDWFSN